MDQLLRKLYNTIYGIFDHLSYERDLRDGVLTNESKIPLIENKQFEHQNTFSNNYLSSLMQEFHDLRIGDIFKISVLEYTNLTRYERFSIKTTAENINAKKEELEKILKKTAEEEK